MVLFVTAVAVVLVVSFTCSIFESVLLSLSRPQVEITKRRHPRAGRMLSRFKENMDVPIAAILILNTAAHTVGAAVAGASYTDVFGGGTLWLFSILFTIAVLLFTEIIPKTLGVSYAAALAVPVTLGISMLTVLLRPLVYVSEAISRSLRGKKEIPVTSPEEIRILARLGQVRGVVGPKTAGMVVGATQLSHLRARDIMLPREEIQFLSANMSRRDVVSLLHQSGHSRFPFSPTGDVDDISGVVLAKKLFHWLLENDGAEINWEMLTHETLIVPDSVPLPRLLRTYQETQRHMAMVVDEYGTVEGIVTLEDLLEEVVGDIRDETDAPINDILEKSVGTIVVRGNVDMRKLSERLGMTWDPNLDVSTVGGLLSERLERIPVVGDSITWNGYRIEVVRADRRRAKLLEIRRE